MASESMTDDELDDFMAGVDAEILAELDRICTPEYVQQRLRDVLRRAGYDPDAALAHSEPAATKAETKIQP